MLGQLRQRRRGSSAQHTGLSLCGCCRMQAWRRTAHSVEALAVSLQREVPDTAATMRLSGLELADAIGEVTLLGADLTEVGHRCPASTAAGTMLSEIH